MSSANAATMDVAEAKVRESVKPAAAMRSGQELIAATRPFMVENVAKSWAHVIFTFAVLASFTAGAAIGGHPAIRLVSGFFAGLTIVRAFILFHDFQHGSLLRGSATARTFLGTFGVLILTPPTVWRATHNYHHQHTAKIVGSHVGSYPMVTTAMWKAMTPIQRFGYAAIRHPLNIFFAYATVFGWGLCAAPFIRNPQKHKDAALSLVLHALITAAVIYFFGAAMWFYAIVVPYSVAFAMGAYLFYAQHNFPGILVQPREQWAYDVAALESSSYMKTGPIMRWFTGNIGYHHVHHLNPAIPFYRLPEAMAAIPELQHPHETSLWPKDVIACFRLKLWDPDAGRMTAFPEAAE